MSTEATPAAPAPPAAAPAAPTPPPSTTDAFKDPGGNAMDLDFTLKSFGWQPEDKTITPDPIPGKDKPADAPAAAPAAPAAPAAATPAPAATPANPYADLITPPAAKPAFTPEMLEVFKAHGIEKPDEFIEQARTASTQQELLRQQLQEYNDLVEAEKGLDPFTQELVRSAREGKNILELARKMPAVDLTKPLAKQSKTDLIKAFAPNALTEADYQALVDNDDPELVKRIEDRINEWMPLVQAKFEAAREAPLAERKQAMEAQKQFAQNYERAVAANVSALPKSMVAVATPEVVKKFASGDLFREMFCEADGRTPKPTALADMLIARDHKVILELAKDTAFKAGQQEAEARLLNKMPDYAGQAGRERSQAQPPKSAEQAQLDLTYQQMAGG